MTLSKKKVYVLGIPYFSCLKTKHKNEKIINLNSSDGSFSTHH